MTAAPQAYAYAPPGVAGMMSAPGVGAYVPQLPQSVASVPAVPAAPAASSDSGAYGRVPKEGRGPPGANLFVYNIPENFADGDLAA
jgi:hypothetical protein